MDIIWITIVAAIAIIGIASTVAALVGARAPRVPPDPERLALLRDRFADDQARRRLEQVEERVAQERDARTAAPQRRATQERSARISTERLWAGGL